MLADRRAQPAVSDEPQKKYAVLPSPVAETGELWREFEVTSIRHGKLR
jgi:hypothetical protein